MDVFTWIEPTAAEVPIVLSLPHVGTHVPDAIGRQLKPEQAASLDDTDWFLDRLYAFAPARGMAMLRANYHRWVIDLNRPPGQQPLYADGRITTGLCPTTDFYGNPIYCDNRSQLATAELEARRHHYFDPYHQALRERLDRLKSLFGHVLLWDCHSIRSHLPAIHPAPFPPLILGSAGGISASPVLIETALNCLGQSGFQTTHNQPFQGGYITRHYGRPAEQIHALQLEMTKCNYLDDTERHYHSWRADRLTPVLQQTLSALANQLLA